MPEGPDAPEPDDPLPPPPTGRTIPSPDPGGPRDRASSLAAADTGFTSPTRSRSASLFVGARGLRRGRRAVAPARARVLGVADLPRARARPPRSRSARSASSWIDPIDDATLLEHLAEVALIIALFSAGLKLDRAADAGATGARSRGCSLIAMPLTIGLIALLGSQLLGLSAGGRAAARRAARAHRPGARRRHRRRPAGRRGRARAELRAHRRGGRSTTGSPPRSCCSALFMAERGWQRLDRRVARRRRRLRDRRSAWRSAPPSAAPRPGASSGCATASCSRRPSTATTRSPPCS